jgi:hypothetical protein
MGFASVPFLIGSAMQHQPLARSATLNNPEKAAIYGQESSRNPAEASEPASASASSFSERCHSAGVVKCVGFDTPEEIYPHLHPNGDGQVHGALDSEVKASGGGSLRFDVPPLSGQNSAGTWDSDLGATFGPGDTFYVQFRQRLDQNLVRENFGGEGWKQVIIYGHPQPCAHVELATQNIFYRGFPQMFTDCGARGLYTNGGSPPYLMQQGDYNCEYGHVNAKECSVYVADQWMTFYYKVKLGGWGKPESSVEAWVGYEGKPLKKFIDMHDFPLNFNEGPGDRFDRILFTPYDTNKPGNEKHPEAHTWYDELVISRRPISAPSGPTPK